MTASERPADDATQRHPITPPTMRHMHGLFRNHGLATDEAVHAYLSALLGREIKSRKDLTEAEARQAIGDLNEPAVADNPGGHASLTLALIAVQAVMPKVVKNKTADLEKYSYKYADLGDVCDAVMPLLNKNGVAFTCLSRLTPSGGYELAGTLIHASGDREESALPLFGRSAQDIGSSITYARRYLIGCMTGLVTDEDKDGSIAAAQQRAEQQPPPYDGPAPEVLVDRLSELAIQQGTDLETITAKRRSEWFAGIPVDRLVTVDPRGLEALVHEIETWIREHPAPAGTDEARAAQGASA